MTPGADTTRSNRRDPNLSGVHDPPQLCCRPATRAVPCLEEGRWWQWVCQLSRTGPGSAECLEFRLSYKFVDTTAISEITSKTAVGPEMSERVTVILDIIISLITITL